MIAASACLTACISDEISSSSSDRPEFSSDSLRFGQVWMGETSPAVAVTVYNRCDKVMRITDVSVSGVRGADVRLNVDGFSGTAFHDLDIRPGDSIIVLADVLPEAPVIGGRIDFSVNGAVTSLPFVGEALDPLILRDVTVTADTRLEAGAIVRVFGCLTVADGATLLMEEGASVYFHDGASLCVAGRLVAQGTPDAQIKLCGDRLGNVVTSIPFDIIPGQWGGVSVEGGSVDMKCVNVFNPVVALKCGEEAEVSLDNCRLTNASQRVVDAASSCIDAVGCEFSSSPDGVVVLNGGRASFGRCTFASDYLFAASTGALLQLSDEATVEVGESIFFGSCPDLSPANPSGALFERCTFRSHGSDDNMFVGCLWNCDPLFDVDAGRYVFDYRLKQDSPARAILCGVRTDRYGVSGSLPGAYNS
ncbi:hypothetical protein [Paramuribaculum intestinale]|uniref:hypothetical protein n=2 Tax=Paramuribaculum intestinale TaxID=2094151 RepID=UPI0025A9CD53|nr:hypothetical protein [Paramuribaculum intestinale]